MKSFLSANGCIRKIKLCSTALLSLFSAFSPILATEDEQKKTELIVEDFSSNDPSGKNLPSGWFASRKEISMFSMLRDGSEKFLRIQTKGGCTSIGKQQKFSVDQFPLLSWKWRIHKLPAAGNETQMKKNDSGAGVYVFFKGKFKLNNIIKYVWSSTLAAGTETCSPYNKRTRIIVLKSGAEKAGKWIRETVNIQDDYRRLFGHNPPEIEGIGILSDADNTGSEAMADYDEIKLLKDDKLEVSSGK